MPLPNRVADYFVVLTVPLEDVETSGRCMFSFSSSTLSQKAALFTLI